LQVRVLPGPPAFARVCGHFENDSISALRTTRFRFENDSISHPDDITDEFLDFMERKLKIEGSSGQPLSATQGVTEMIKT
jgi:hypothetical protein